MSASLPPLPASAEASRATPDRLGQDLAQAIKADGLLLHYQPRVCLHRRVVTGAEALARWPHHRRGMIPPGTFIPMAESSGLIVPLGGWALRRACCEAMRWPAGIISVNVSARQLAGGEILQQVAWALEESGLPPERLELELTETMLIEASVETLLTLSAIRDLGIGLALDDFGTGYASLSALKRLPITVLKLDRSFIRGAPAHAEDRALVEAAVAVGRALRLEIVAEGIVDEQHRRYLTELGCHQGQAFMFSKPVPSGRFLAQCGALGGLVEQAA